MRQQLRESACRYVETLACANDRTWSEAGFCIFDLAEDDARMLGRAYEQNAIIGAALDSAPHLIRSEEHTSELQSLMRISYAVFCLKKQKTQDSHTQKRIQAIN